MARVEGSKRKSASGIPDFAKASVETSFNATKIGGVVTKHCWYIPIDGASGKECKLFAAIFSNG
ncbi:hypothetical protein PsorP6_008614 [Peronosclerospora sorghi]|uniref:Uncharacterized protein n=1 Tax=Peronosclerospora sorghi TaxID=230839 RepID=A0ACC0WC10_9STRA|nr:hypothetical protein PsorP6_008614 [Peronosclerospora sorghi]